MKFQVLMLTELSRKPTDQVWSSSAVKIKKKWVDNSIFLMESWTSYTSQVKVHI